MENILGKIRGDYIAAASKQCPPADSTDAEQVIEFDVPHIGLARLYFIRKEARHHKHGHYFWVAHRAEKV